MSAPIGNRRRNSLAEINVTPLVDVMLVLLIIFMVTAPLMQMGADVQLPKATLEQLPSGQEQLVLTIMKDGAVQLGSTAMEMEFLGQKMKAIVSQRGDEMIYIAADERVPYGRVMKVFAELRAHNLTHVGLITEPE